ncbi:MAG: DNA modification methylase [Candidatus Marinimicrobia bacterium]|nr:DNA modification methylase [Candidatus Neomarinimicrobiota bacterium]
MNVISKQLKDIIPYHGNPRNHSDASINAVASSINEFGFKVPIVIDKQNIIVAGHGRYFAAKKLGIQEVPVVVADDLTPVQIKAYRLADNKVAEQSTWDDELLDMELQMLNEMDFDMELFGFDEFEVEIENEGHTDPDDVPEEPPSICKKGDIWKLGDHLLICGDATDPATYKRLFKNKSMASLLLTDPPYNVDYTGGNEKALKIQNDKMDDEEYLQFLVDSLRHSVGFLRKGSSFYLFHADTKGLTCREAVIEAGLSLRQCLIWYKLNGFVMGRQDYQWQHEPCLYGWKPGEAHNWYGDRSQATVLEFNKPDKSLDHPTMKPVDLLSYLIQNSSQKENIVLDPFLGSGSTLISCERHGRVCYGVELDPKYCDVIIHRWELYTDEKAERIEEL